MKLQSLQSKADGLYQKAHRSIHPLHVCLGIYSCLLTLIGICSVVADHEDLPIGPHSYKAGIVALVAAVFIWFGNGYLVYNHYISKDRATM